MAGTSRGPPALLGQVVRSLRCSGGGRQGTSVLSVPHTGHRPPVWLRRRPNERVPDDARHHTDEDENEEHHQEDAPWLHERGAAGRCDRDGAEALRAAGRRIGGRLLPWGPVVGARPSNGQGTWRCRDSRRSTTASRRRRHHSPGKSIVLEGGAARQRRRLPVSDTPGC